MAKDRHILKRIEGRQQAEAIMASLLTRAIPQHPEAKRAFWREIHRQANESLGYVDESALTMTDAQAIAYEKLPIVIGRQQLIPKTVPVETLARMIDTLVPLRRYLESQVAIARGIDEARNRATHSRKSDGNDDHTG